MENLVEKICNDLKTTYDARLLNDYPESLQKVFFEVAEKNKNNKKKNTNSSLISLVNNLKDPKSEKVDYITGPSEIMKLKSDKYNKTIYLIGENDHSNINGCKSINLIGKKHLEISDYLLYLFKTSPIFIDFYVEWPILFGNTNTFKIGSGQTLYDMFNYMKGCVTNLKHRECPYNVRIHSVDARKIQGKNKYKKMYYGSTLSKMADDIRSELFFDKLKKHYILFNDFKILYKNEIDLLSTVSTYDDIINIISNDIKKNKLLSKELSKCSLSYDIIVNTFLHYLKLKLRQIFPRGITFVGEWFKYAKKSRVYERRSPQRYPDGLHIIEKFMTMVTATIMDIYTISRMFKVFDVKKNEHYPLEPFNIIFYGGNAHTQSLMYFLYSIGFKLIENEYTNLISCLDMKKIKQPLFL
jgi:hypothetical protein